MSKKYEVTLTFKVEATFEIKQSEFDDGYYDLTDPDQLKEALEEYVLQNLTPGMYYQDYSGRRSMICIRDKDYVGYEIGYLNDVDDTQFEIKFEEAVEDTKE